MHELTQKEFAAEVGLTTRQVANLQAQGIPHRTDGRRKLFPMPAAFQWYLTRKIDAAVAAMQPTGFEEARAREMAARAELAEFEVAKMRREMLHLDEWEHEYARPLAILRAGLLSLPGRIAAELPMPADEAVDIIEPIVRRMMEELSERVGENDGAEGAA